MQSHGAYLPVLPTHHLIQSFHSFYCIVLLATLFVSSCYWQPFPLDTPLSAPWAENITTFAEALNSTLSSNYTGPIPPVIRAVDRCWCDIARGGFFVPFNVSEWERASVLRLKDKLESQQAASLSSQEVLDTLDGTVDQKPPEEMDLKLNSTDLWFKIQLPQIKWRPFFYKGSKDSGSPAASENEDVHEKEPKGSDEDVTGKSEGGVETQRPPPYVASRRELDLRPLGIDMVLNYDWSSS